MCITIMQFSHIQDIKCYKLLDIKLFKKYLNCETSKVFTIHLKENKDIVSVEYIICKLHFLDNFS